MEQQVLLQYQSLPADLRREVADFIEFLTAKHLKNGEAQNPNNGDKAQLLAELREAVQNVNLAKQGKIKARPLSELLHEL